MRDRYLELVTQASEREQRPLRVFAEVLDATSTRVWNPWMLNLAARKTYEWERARAQERTLISSRNGGE
jgi:hypothetical protein